jgi:hypothetical protein
MISSTRKTRDQFCQKSLIRSPEHLQESRNVLLSWPQPGARLQMSKRHLSASVESAARAMPDPRVRNRHIDPSRQVCWYEHISDHTEDIELSPSKNLAPSAACNSLVFRHATRFAVAALDCLILH